MNSGIPVIDLFAGPGGLCEGISSVLRKDGGREFDVRLSIEKDPVAHRTLSLRALYRSFPIGKVPAPYYQYLRREITRQQLESDPQIKPYFEKSLNEARCAELGKDDHKDIDEWITSALGGSSDWLLIGGPPCQAYSLAGRARMRGKNPESFEADKRHFLYKEYLRIIKEFSPSVFVMENVKGMLTSQNSGSPIVDRILSDLRSPGNGYDYRIRSFVVPGEIDDPTNFVIKSENLGIPQSRHRVILFGIRDDIAALVPELDTNPEIFVIPEAAKVNLKEVLAGLPALRSKLSGRGDGLEDSLDNWQKTVEQGFRVLTKQKSQVSPLVLGRAEYSSNRARSHLSTGARFIKGNFTFTGPLADWYLDPHIGGVTLHETRSHMETDIHRYLFASSFAKELGRSPKIQDFPNMLLPSHENVGKELVPFADRFRVQLMNQPSTTIVSHIAKDGHYYIHYDPSQCRSLTVREAARLQTFPDNYFFEGNRTEQYHQVGNAVPPLLARKIGQVILKLIQFARR